MPDAPLGFQCRSVTASVRESPSAHRSIGHASDFTMQCNSRANGLLLVKIRCHFARVVAVLQHFSPGKYRVSTEHAVRDILRNLSDRAARICIRLANPKQPNGAIRGSERLERAITGAFCDLRTAG